MARILRPDKGSITRQRQGVGAARARRRLPPRAVGPRERLPQRLDPRPDASSEHRRAGSTRSSTSPASSSSSTQPVKNYSSGMYVRLGFSVAINVDPDILLVDEVLAVGDAAFQRKCMEKFADFRRAGKTVVRRQPRDGPDAHASATRSALARRAAGWSRSARPDRRGRRLRRRGPRRPGDDVERQRPGGARARRRITELELLGHDRAGRPTWSTPATPVRPDGVRRAGQPVAKPVFGLALETLEGVYVVGPPHPRRRVRADRASPASGLDRPTRIPRLRCSPAPSTCPPRSSTTRRPTSTTTCAVPALRRRPGNTAGVRRDHDDEGRLGGAQRERGGDRRQVSEPLFSIITPVYQPPPDVLERMLDSVRTQTFEDWEHCVVDDAGEDSRVWELLERAAREDPRSVSTAPASGAGSSERRTPRSSSPAASSSPCSTMTTSSPRSRCARSRRGSTRTRRPTSSTPTRTSSTTAAGGSTRSSNPDWSPDRLRGQMYTGHLCVLRRSLVEEIGGFRPGFDGSQD